MIKKRLYVIVDQALASGLKMAQACHAMRQFTEEHPALDRAWYTESNNIAVLQAGDLVQLANDLSLEGLQLSRFLEPDLDDALTAICVEPMDGRRLARLDLAA